MRPALAACRFATIALLAMAAPPSPRAASVPEAGAPKTLRAAAFEATPATVGKGRFRLAARLQPARATVAGDEATGTRKLVATLMPKGLSGVCALPEAIFSDGFESP